MKFLHTADTHLGRRNFKLEERENDFENAFRQVVDIAITEKTEFIIHSGDIFDTGKPNHRELLFAVTELNRLKKEKIPFFTIAGNHDINLDQTAITILERVGLLTNLSSSRYYESENGKIKVKGEIIGNVFLCGIPGRTGNARGMYELIEPEKKGKYNIFLFHHTISSVSTLFEDIPTALLPKGFDYYAGGHWHTPYEEKYDNGIIIYPGSTEYADLTEMKNERKKRVVIADTETGEIKEIKLNTREVIVKEIDCGELLPEEVNLKCENALEKNEKKALIILELKGKLKGGTKGEIDKIRINKKAEEKGYLHCNIKTSDILTHTQQFDVNTKGKNINEIETAYLKGKEYTETQITLSKAIIQRLGDENSSQKELQDYQNRIMEEIEHNTEKYKLGKH